MLRSPTRSRSRGSGASAQDTDLHQILQQPPVLAFVDDAFVPHFVHEDRVQVDRTPGRRELVDVASDERSTEVP